MVADDKVTRTPADDSDKSVVAVDAADGEFKRNSMRLEWLDPHTLQPHERNPRSHPVSQADALTAFMKDVGWLKPLLYNERTHRILDGKLRHQIAIEKNFDEVPVIVVDVDANREPDILLLFDRLGDLAVFDQAGIESLTKDAGEQSKRILAAIGASEEGKVEDWMLSGLAHPPTWVDPKLAQNLPPGGLALIPAEEYNYIVLLFKNEVDFVTAQDVFGVQQVACPFHAIGGSSTGLGRVIDGTKWIRKHSEIVRKMLIGGSDGS